MNKINGYLFRLYRIINRSLIKYSNNKRPPSYPYISGDSFRDIANFIYDETNTKIDPTMVKLSDIIFVRTSYLKDFMEAIHTKIANKYILITHNADDAVTEINEKYLDEKIIKWYAMSVLVKNPKIIPIPAGLENLHYFVSGITKLFDKYSKSKVEKKNKILFGFSISTNPKDRKPAYDFLTKFSLAEEIKGMPNSNIYLKKLNFFKFVASPPGNGIEAHRTWEAMYLDVVPIVKRSVMMEYFKGLGLPLWIIDDWKELEKFSEHDLNNKYDEIMSKKDKRPLYMDYWIERIKKGI